jgi:hypothetical protein
MKTEYRTAKTPEAVARQICNAASFRRFQLYAHLFKLDDGVRGAVFMAFTGPEGAIDVWSAVFGGRFFAGLVRRLVPVRIISKGI